MKNKKKLELVKGGNDNTGKIKTKDITITLSDEEYDVLEKISKIEERDINRQAKWAVKKYMLDFIEINCVEECDCD